MSMETLFSFSGSINQLVFISCGVKLCSYRFIEHTHKCRSIIRNWSETMSYSRYIYRRVKMSQYYLGLFGRKCVPNTVIPQVVIGNLNKLIVATRLA